MSKKDRVTNQSFKKLIKTFPGGIAYLDDDLFFSFCNDVQASYFGRQAKDVIGHRLHDVVPNNPDFCRHLEQAAVTGVRSPQIAMSVTWSERPEEGEHHYLVSSIADLDRHGRVHGIFMTALEVTPAILGVRETEAALRGRNKELEDLVTEMSPAILEARETAAALRGRNKELEDIILEKDLLVGIISHELRTPLTTIFGNAHLLLRRLEDLDDDSRTRAINDIRTEAERLNRLVENMLLLARAGAQEAVPTEPVMLKKAIGEVVLEQSKRAEDRQIVVSVKPSDLMAEGQPDYLRQVLQNLLGNAEKYSPPTHPITIRARRTGPEVSISVLDRGSGVDPHEAEIIFQPFYRSARTATAVPGAGIGLAVCKLLVQSQSGTIVARPLRGGGSDFTFTLPASAESTTEGRP